MTYVPGVEADIVISFADADNAQGTDALAEQVAKKWPDQTRLAERVRELEAQLATVTSGSVAIEIRGLEQGWVSGFEFILREFVEQILGENVEVELCSESAPRDTQARVAKSAVLLSVFSPASIDERILHGHVESFLSGSRDEESGVPTKERAFLVEKLPVDSTAALKRFDEAHTQKLWAKDSQTGEAHPLPASLSDSAVQPEGEREFLKRTYELARSIAEVLRSMRPVEPPESEPLPGQVDEARRQVDAEVAPIGENAQRRIEEQRPETSRAEATVEGETPSVRWGADDGQLTAPAPAPETSDVMTGTIESDDGDASEPASGPRRYTVYVDYDRRDRRAASAVAGYMRHLNDKRQVGIRLLKPHWRTEVQDDSEQERPCEHCGRSSESPRVDEQADIDLGFLKRVRQSHVTLVVFSEAGTEWAEERQAKIIKFDTDPRETPGITNVESVARAVYVHLPGQEHKRERADMRDWTQPYDQFTQLPAKPSDSLQPAELDDFLTLARESNSDSQEDVSHP